MLLQGDVVSTSDQAQKLMQEKIADGTALQRLVAYLEFTGAEFRCPEELAGTGFRKLPSGAGGFPVPPGTCKPSKGVSWGRP